MVCNRVWSQHAVISGYVRSNQIPIEAVRIVLEKTTIGVLSDSSGYFSISIPSPGIYTLQANHIEFKSFNKQVAIDSHTSIEIAIELEPIQRETMLEEVVISGTLSAVKKSDSPVPVEIYTPTFFKKNPTPTLFDALQLINGIRPQINCNICNTGDIHINGLEGPYTMILIDGMPIVSSLGTVYGLSGIPSSLIQKMEVVKGPASALYGSEAVAGVINVITQQANLAPRFSADVFATSWGETSADIGYSSKWGKKIHALTGVSYYNFSNKVDKNKDGFTDVSLQHRISFFQKATMIRKLGKVFSLATRYLYEDRWGGDMRWNASHRGSNTIYGESIFTNRVEAIGNYQLPLKETVFLQFSYVYHHQNSYYGTMLYQGKQQIAFAQAYWQKNIGRNYLLAGTAFRYTYYDDNTTATFLNQENKADHTYLPGVFIQDEIRISKTHSLLLGMRYDYNFIHKSIVTPRLAYKWAIKYNHILRINAGTGFRVVNLFTEDHAALSGARNVVIKNALKPERSYNANMNYTYKHYFKKGDFLSLDATLFYTYFSNRILPDYDSNPQQIIYDNSEGYAQSYGLSCNVNLSIRNSFTANIGATLMNNTLTENGMRVQQILTERVNATWALSYKISKIKLSIDYSGNLYSPMRLPVIGENDPRPAYSPWWSIQNIQCTYTGLKRIEIYAGIKNLLDWTPAKVKNTPFIIARSHDPFDTQVQYDANGDIVATADNPNALRFSPEYVYAPNQGIRFFVGVRYTIPTK